MTIDEVKKRVEAIKAVGNDDPEGSHCDEDRLHQGVLRAIANGYDGGVPKLLAREALKTCDIEFPRWCA